MSEVILEVENLSFIYPDNYQALKNISFKIEKGSKVFFHGENGAGKSTLFQCLTGLLKVKVGQIKISSLACPKEKERMKRISIVFQNANDQIIAGSVFDEVAFGPLNMGLSEQEAIARVENALKLMNIEDLRNRPPHFLSYGQKKRVALASILSMNQDIIILDEPTAGLDTKQSEELINILNNLAKSGTTLMISSHDAEFSNRCADKIIVLHKGEILADGFPRDVFSNRDMLLKTGLKKPIIMEIYDALEKNNLVKSDETPKNLEQLLSLIEDVKK